MELHPHPLLRFVLHPQFVAVKSLIVYFLQRFFLFMVYTMWDGLDVFPVGMKKILFVANGTHGIGDSGIKDTLSLDPERSGTKLEKYAAHILIPR